MRVAARREDGKANAELLRVLADVLAVRVRQVRIVSGSVSPDKVVAIEGLSAHVVAVALARASAGTRFQDVPSSAREKRR